VTENERKWLFFRSIFFRTIIFQDMRIKLITLLCVVFVFASRLSAQDAIVQEGEFGVGIGGSHYFGDLNTRARLNRIKPAATIFFRKNFGNYISARIGASFAQVGYSDIYNTHNEYMYRRNLSFNSNVWELALQGDFNFFRFMPGEPQYNFTPYVTLGVGVFSYDPYAYLKGEKVFLRPLGTEGQGSSLYPDRKQYSTMGISFPIGAGIKYSINERVNIAFEILHRITTTDYLDDVSTTYPDKAAFPLNPDGSASQASLLSDRSYETGEPIGITGRQRGNSQQKDQFVTAMIHLTFNLQSYRCPSAKD
jgi:hypothetical protein